MIHFKIPIFTRVLTSLFVLAVLSSGLLAKDEQFCRLIVASLDQSQKRIELENQIIKRTQTVAGLKFLYHHLNEFHANELISHSTFDDDIESGVSSEKMIANNILQALHLMERASRSNKYGMATLEAMEARGALSELAANATSINLDRVSLESPSSLEDSSQVHPSFGALFTGFRRKMEKSWPQAHPGVVLLQSEYSLTTEEWKEEFENLKPLFAKQAFGLRELFQDIQELHRDGMLFQETDSLFFPSLSAAMHIRRFELPGFSNEPEYSADSAYSEDSSDSNSQRPSYLAILHVIWKIRLAASAPDEDIRDYCKRWLKNFFQAGWKSKSVEATEDGEEMLTHLGDLAAEFIP
ncbi:MAG: hypothetical protein JWQ35_2379 [Bacteriovoracaceae bacterium]|nr:hypothetical protein [Bacteriovoracaceae bacterium]